MYFSFKLNIITFSGVSSFYKQILGFIRLVSLTLSHVLLVFNDKEEKAYSHA